MGFPKRQAAIVGVYNTEQGKLPDRTSFSLQLEAIRGALDDAGMTLDDIDGLLPMSGSNHVAGFDGPTAAHQVLGRAARRPADQSHGGRGCLRPAGEGGGGDLGGYV